MHKRIAVSTALALLLALLPTTATAYQGFGAKTFPPSAYGGSPDPGEPSGIDPDVQSFAASYNTATGALAVHLRFYGPVTDLTGGSQLNIVFGIPNSAPTASNPNPFNTSLGCSGNDTTMIFGSDVNGNGSDAVEAIVSGSGGQTAPYGPTERAGRTTATQTTDADGLGVTLEVPAGLPWMTDRLITCADIDLSYAYPYDPNGNVPFTISLTPADAKSAFVQILAKNGIVGHRPVAGLTRCSSTSTTAVRCQAVGRQGDETATITGTMTRKLANPNVYGSFAAMVTTPCGARRCTKTVRFSGSAAMIGF